MAKSRNLANTSSQGSVSNVIVVPTGTTAQRTSATAGFIRYNTDLNSLESANGTAWANVGSGSASSGGGVSWQAVQNTNFIAVAGNGYGVNTATGNVTVTLPLSPTTGQQIQFLDYGQTFSANGLTLYPNGNKLLGNTANITISSSGTSVGLVYFDVTKGWVPYTGFPSSIVGSYAINYLIVAGGGGGGLSSPNYSGGGGGAGGLISGTGINVTPGTQYSVVVGAGAAIQASNSFGNNGSNSTAFGYVALGGGGGGGGSSSTPSPAPSDGRPGGSGGGSAHNGSTGSSPAGSGTSGQGNPGGTGFLGAPAYGGGGGGGSGSSGANGTTNSGGNGGSGTTWSNGTTYAGGGGGGSNTPGPAGSGGSGGGGPGGYIGAGTAGGTNTGGGGGGFGVQNVSGGAGGSGVVIIQYQGNLQKAFGGNVLISGGYVYHTFTTSGTYIA